MPKQTQQLSLRIPVESKEWLESYLKKYSYGASFSEMFLNMINEIRRLDSLSVTFINLEATKKELAEKAKAEVKEVWGNIDNFSEICVRFPTTFKRMKATERNLLCGRCRTARPIEFKACRELRTEKTKSEGKQN